MSNKTKIFETLHADYYLMVHQMCMGFMKGNTQLAEDLIQETFINIWRSLSKFESASSYKTWIYRITSNTCLKYIRDYKVRQHVSIEEQTSFNNIKSQPHEVEEDYRELYQAIGQLSEVDRLIIMMVLDELQYNEIAEVLGISKGNLRVKIHRIKKTLKNILDNE